MGSLILIDGKRKMLRRKKIWLHGLIERAFVNLSGAS